MSGGGSGGSGTQQYNWNDVLAPQWANAISWADALSDPTGFGQYQQYTGPGMAPGQTPQSISQLQSLSSNDPTGRIANLSPDTQQAITYNEALANLSSNPIPSMDAARSMETSTLNGQQYDPWAYQMITNQTNPYVGNSPAFQSALQQGLGNITNAYNMGTAADTQRAFAQSGAFGGSAYNQAVGANQNALANQLQQFTSGMVNDQYNRSAQLQDSQLNRDLQADTTNKTLGQDATENEMNRQIQTIPLAQNEQQLAYQRDQQLAGAGDISNAYNQSLLNQAYQDYQNQHNQQYNMLDFLSGILGRAQGGVAPNVQTTLPSYQASPYSQLLGAGLLGYSMMP